MKKWLVYATTALVVVLMAGLTACQWEQVKESFWQYSFLDLVDIVVMLLIAVVIVYQVNHQLSSAGKQKELLLRYIEKLEGDFQATHVEGIQYMAKPTDLVARRILARYKALNVQLDFLRRLGVSRAHDCIALSGGSLITMVKEHRDILTDKQFLTSKPKYDSDCIKRYEMKYENIWREIGQCKFHLFK